jgi:hypothetical protein
MNRLFVIHIYIALDYDRCYYQYRSYYRYDWYYSWYPYNWYTPRVWVQHPVVVVERPRSHRRLVPINANTRQRRTVVRERPMRITPTRVVPTRRQIVRSTPRVVQPRQRPAQVRRNTQPVRTRRTKPVRRKP